MLDRDKPDKVYKRVKVNKGASGVDGKTMYEVLPLLNENGSELLEKKLKLKVNSEKSRAVYGTVCTVGLEVG